jgi:hypothetical protein
MVKLENNSNTRIILAAFALPSVALRNVARGLDEPLDPSF